MEWAKVAKLLSPACLPRHFVLRRRQAPLVSGAGLPAVRQGTTSSAVLVKLERFSLFSKNSLLPESGAVDQERGVDGAVLRVLSKPRSFTETGRPRPPMPLSFLNPPCLSIPGRARHGLVLPRCARPPSRPECHPRRRGVRPLNTGAAFRKSRGPVLLPDRRRPHRRSNPASALRGGRA